MEPPFRDGHYQHIVSLGHNELLQKGITCTAITFNGCLLFSLNKSNIWQTSVLILVEETQWTVSYYKTVTHMINLNNYTALKNPNRTEEFYIYVQTRAVR